MRLTRVHFKVIEVLFCSPHNQANSISSQEKYQVLHLFKLQEEVIEARDKGRMKR